MSALLKTFPFKGSHHLCDATCIVVVIPDESSSATLSSFQLSYIDVRVWVPNSCCIFQLGPEECLVSGVLDVLRTVGQVSAKKGSGIVCLLGNCINMCIPRQCVTDQDSRVLYILGVSKFFAMDGVVGINRLPLLSDPNYLHCCLNNLNMSHRSLYAPTYSILAARSMLISLFRVTSWFDTVNNAVTRWMKFRETHLHEHDLQLFDYNI